MSRKPVVPAAIADALTAPKPPTVSTRAVSVLARDEVTDKTIDELTSEILALQIQGNKVLFAIGKRLIAAKEKLSHGDWLPWLDSVNIPERLAQRYMRLAREWSANPSILSDLGMSKALALLALPGDVRDEFVAEAHVVNGEEKSVADMSAKELADAIKARKEAEDNLEITQRQLAESERLRSEAIRTKMEIAAELQKTSQSLEIARKSAQDTRNLLEQEQQARIAVADELATLKAKPVDVAIEKVADPEAIEAAKQAERASMQFLVDKANTERDVEHANANRIRDDMGRVQAELVKTEKALDDANKAAQEAAKDAQSARQELERVKSEKTPIADKDLSLFSVLFEQTQAAINKMHGIVLKLPPDKQESTRKVLSALADNIRKAAES